MHRDPNTGYKDRNWFPLRGVDVAAPKSTAVIRYGILDMSINKVLDRILDELEDLG